MRATLTPLKEGKKLEVRAIGDSSSASSYGQFVWETLDGQPVCTVGMELSAMYSVSDILIESAEDLLALGQAIRHDRLMKGLSLREFAAICNVTPQTIPNLEEGRHAIRADLLIQVLNALGWKMRIK